MLLLLVVACASDKIAWAVNHASVIPEENGLSGTQTWEFFTEGWTPDSGDKHFACARVQTITGVVSSAPECADCDVVYTMSFDELQTDCEGDEADDPSYRALVSFGIGDTAPDFDTDDPHPDKSLGWYVSVDGVTIDAFGWAWDEALDFEGDPGPPGWQSGTAYTLWPAVAWEL